MPLPLLAAALLVTSAPVAATAEPAPPKTQAAPTAAPAAAQPTLRQPAISPKTESACGIVTKDDAKAKPEFHETAGLKILGGPMRLTLPQSAKPIAAIYCKRDTVLPGQGDGRVLLEFRRQLVLQDASREGVLLITDKGAFGFKMTVGTLSDAEKQSVLDRLQIFQANLNAVLAAQAKVEQTKGSPAAKAQDAPVVTTRK
jgi:hypothetical protein